MKTTIVFAHPWDGSFNKAILLKVEDKLKAQNKDYQIIDLYKEGFDPVLREQDLALYSEGETSDLLVKKYQEILKNTNELIFIFPIWWYDVPAMIKGFIDKVMLKNFSYISTKTGLKGLLTHIKKATVVTTSEAPTWYIKWIAGNTIKRTFINVTLKSIGIRNTKWVNNPNTTSGKRKNREKFLHDLVKI